MKKHIKTCVHNSRDQEGRGVLVTCMSKTTVNLIIDLINSNIKSRIAAEVKNGGMFSVELDTTRDMSAKDQ